MTGSLFGEVSLDLERLITGADRKASSNTGFTALQLAKLAGIRVIAVADVVRHGARLLDAGADVLVDRHDPSRAIEIIRSITKGKLRFALDTVGKETAAHLQESLQRSKGRDQGHLVGLTGLPKTRLPGVKYHSVPIKLFHSVPVIGEQAVDWLEQLLVTKTLQPPEVSIADGGLEGINGALDKLRNGSVSGKRLVVPIGSEKITAPDVNGAASGSTETKATGGSLDYADKLNSDTSRIKFA